jgi:hypothetical protein
VCRDGPVPADFWLTQPAVGLVIRIICDAAAALTGRQTLHPAVHRTNGSIIKNPPAHFPAWPGDAAVTVALTFDVDGEAPWLSEGPEYARRLTMLSQDRLGPGRGLGRILGLLAELEVTATFYVPGRHAAAVFHCLQLSSVPGQGHLAASCFGQGDQVGQVRAADHRGLVDGQQGARADGQRPAGIRDHHQRHAGGAQSVSVGVGNMSDAYRTVDNPGTGETITFVETSEESDGARVVALITLAPGGAVAPHSHRITETFECVEGAVTVRLAGRDMAFPPATLALLDADWRNGTVWRPRLRPDHGAL